MSELPQQPQSSKITRIITRATYCILFLYEDTTKMRRSFLSMLLFGFFLALVSLQNDVVVDARIHASGDDAAAIPVKRQQQQQQRSSSVGNLLQGSSSQRSLGGGAALASDAATATLPTTIRNLANQQQSWARDDDGNFLWWIWLIIGLSSCCCCFICWFVSLCFAFMCTSGYQSSPREPRLIQQPHILFQK